jgi:hypothetical protein
MREMRKVLEYRKIKQDFPVAKFFADWILHTTLNNSRALALVERLNIASANNEPLELVVSEALSLSQLRQDMISIFDIAEVSTKLLNTASYWFRFSAQVLSEIAHQPIGFADVFNPAGRGKEAETLGRMQSITSKMYGLITSGHYLYFDRFTILEPQGDDPHFKWQLEFRLEDGTRMGVTGLLVFNDTMSFPPEQSLR